MLEPLTKIKDFYDDIITNYSDPRTRDWAMVKSPVPMLILITMYVIFVKIIGPKMMKNRKPYELKTAMIVYNALQAFISIYFFIGGTMYGWFTRYSFLCQPIVDDHPHDSYILSIGWYLYLVRFLEFTDTIFFILRKKFAQVTTLHVVHHSIVPIIFWLGETFAPAGHYTLASYLNTFVHFFMYTYYLLAALGPKYHRYIWWKKYMTELQLIQFVLVLIHTIYTLISDCDVPKTFAYVILFQAMLFFFMFLNFYYKSFTIKTTTKGSLKHMQLNGKVSDPLDANEVLQESFKTGHSREKLHVHSD